VLDTGDYLPLLANVVPLQGFDKFLYHVVAESQNLKLSIMNIIRNTQSYSIFIVPVFIFDLSLQSGMMGFNSFN